MKDDAKEQQSKSKKTKLELILDFGRDCLDYLDRNKFEGCIFWAGVSAALVAWSIGTNADNINKIISLFK